VKAVGIEGGDVGNRARGMLAAKPHIVGYNCAGVVREVGAQVSDRKVGDRVSALMFNGSHAERAAVAAAQTWLVPDALSFEHAACVPVAWGTAHDCLFEFGRLQRGESLLIQAGKSSTTAQLGRALASAGDKVLLVDCDLRRPTQHVHLGLTRDNGLTDFLAAPQPFFNWRAYVKTAGSESLHVVTCGPIPPNPPELLGSERFKRFLAEARDAYDWVLLDSPPAGPASSPHCCSQRRRCSA
jgi:hypothetical protein